MIRARVHLELAIHRVPEFGFRQHPADGLFDQSTRLPRADVHGALFAQPAFVSAVAAINLLLFLASRQLDLARIDDDDEITGVDERRVDRLVLALKQARGKRRNAPENGVVGVDDVPPAVSALRAGYERTHE